MVPKNQMLGYVYSRLISFKSEWILKDKTMFPPKKILYPINIDSKHIFILNEIFEIAKKLEASIDLLYVNDQQAGYRHPHKTEIDVKNSVIENAHSELMSQLSISYNVSKGDLGKEVSKFCENNNIDLVITGHRRYNRLFSQFFNSDDETIIENVSVPVMVIPERD
jgi:nucleotide-binding universal stress UspA family protein